MRTKFLTKLKALWNMPERLEFLATRYDSFAFGSQECQRDLRAFMHIAQRLDELHPDRRAASDEIGAAAIAKMLAEYKVLDRGGL